MKALRSHASGGPETLQLDEVDTPHPGPGQVRITVKACADRKSTRLNSSHG